MATTATTSAPTATARTFRLEYLFIAFTFAWVFWRLAVPVIYGHRQPVASSRSDLAGYQQRAAAKGATTNPWISMLVSAHGAIRNY